MRYVGRDSAWGFSPSFVLRGFFPGYLPGSEGKVVPPALGLSWASTQGFCALPSTSHSYKRAT